jgi:SAM-dependent methyltransferase
MLGSMEPSLERDQFYYRDDLALVHHLGFGFHADACAPGILKLLEPIRERDGVVVELGCGSGSLTRYLVDAGLRVIATDASDAMLALARHHVPEAFEIRRVVLPDDPIPAADAIVGVGHCLNYLENETGVNEALISVAGALRPGGILAVDLCDLEWGVVRTNQPPILRRTDEWALMTEFSVPEPNRYVREMTIFIRQGDGSWRRDDERHDNVLIETARVPELLVRYGVRATVSDSFGDEELPAGLAAIVGQKAH